MLSIERTKELLADATISDQEAELIRDRFRDLAEIIFNKWSKQMLPKNDYEKCTSGPTHKVRID